MALAYPEGECFFDRSALSTSQADGYHADNLKDFYSNILVEFVWNQWAYHGSKEADITRTHPRSSYDVVTGSLWATRYGVWEDLPFSYGPETSDIKRWGAHDLCTSGNRIRDREKGASAEAWFMQMPMPTKEERCVWIDMLGYIRAIYIPIAHEASKQYPQLCTFIQINFAARGTVDIWRPNWGTFGAHTCDKTYGLQIASDYTVGLDIYGLLQLLSLPRQLRQTNAYSSKMISIVPKGSLKTNGLAQAFKQHNRYDFDWTQIAKANFGLELQWLPHKPNGWFVEYIKNAIKFALDFVPIIGFILQIEFSLGWTALTDPDSFYETLKEEIPLVLLTDGIISELKSEAEKIKKFLPPGWDQVGRALQMRPDQIKDDIGGDKEGSLNGVGPSPTIVKTGKIMAKTGGVLAPADIKSEAQKAEEAYLKEMTARWASEKTDDVPPPEDMMSEAEKAEKAMLKDMEARLGFGGPNYPLDMAGEADKAKEALMQVGL